MPSSPIDELREQLAKHYARLERITLAIGAQDGGSRTSFCFLDSNSNLIVEWNDWTFAIKDIERELQKSWKVVHCDGFGYAYTFRVHHRFRIPSAPEQQP